VRQEGGRYINMAYRRQEVRKTGAGKLKICVGKTAVYCVVLETKDIIGIWGTEKDIKRHERKLKREERKTRRPKKLKKADRSRERNRTSFQRCIVWKWRDRKKKRQWWWVNVVVQKAGRNWGEA
jgi:hypothetical protein